MPDDEHAIATFIVGNTPGASLPYTGGPGTQLFTILGSILILGAGVLLWKRRKLI
jgi:LPXTG-motif cell wall-anchored protein